MAAMAEEDDEQAMEGEALESIFCDQFKEISRSPFHWRIDISPHAPGDGEENHVSISLDSILPADYPNIAPELKITSSVGLTDAQLEELMGLTGRIAEENLGMAMIYTIAEEVQAWLLDHNKPQASGKSMHADMLRRAEAAEQAKEDAAVAVGASSTADEFERAKEEEEERNRQKILEGTPVNAESFAAWNASFMVEIGADRGTKEEEARQNKKIGRAYFPVAGGDEGWVDPELSDEDEDEESLEDLSDIDDDDDDT